MERCPYHNTEEEKSFKKAVIAYYAVMADEGIIIDSDEKIGVILDTYFPNRNAGIKLFRISEPGANEYDNCVCLTMNNKSYEVLSLAVQTAFSMVGIDADVDIERDMREIINFSKSF